jgi:hypothetical protein
MKEHADILFLSSNPSSADRLELDREARALQRAIEDVTPVGDPPLRLTTRWAAEPLDLLREIRSVRPTVLHFAGYGARGTEVGIYLQDQSGTAKLVSAGTLRDTIAAAGSSIRVIVLNTCYTDQQAARLLEIETLDCVIGVEGAIDDDGGRSFVLEFYRALAVGSAVHGAWARAWALLEERGFVPRSRPQLRVRPGGDAQRVFVVGKGRTS